MVFISASLNDVRFTIFFYKLQSNNQCRHTMKNNLLIKYMNDRFRPAQKKVITPGPVITISRECGCSGRVFAEKLTGRINEIINDEEKKWKWVSKEILNLASEELKIHPDKMKTLLNSEEKNFIEELVASFTDKYYVYDAKIKGAIEEVIRNIAVRGNTVIVGRGSEAITNDIAKSLHIKLYAPLSWKVAVMSERMGISPEESKNIVQEVDKKRLKFRDAYVDKHSDAVIYDIEFNCAKFNQDDMVDIVLKLAEKRSLI